VGSEGLILDIVLGVIGRLSAAIVSLFGAQASGVNIYSMFVAVVGAVVVLVFITRSLDAERCSFRLFRFTGTK
jgi:uncharacterized membrane protein YeaQ/YmgE (transglycosylase-associated protein family)